MVETGVLEPEMVKTTPLDSSTYDFLFNTARYPSKPEDHARKFDPSKNNHIVVVRKGKFYEFEVVDKQGGFLSEKDLMRYVFRLCAVSWPFFC
jgi:carnitine O-acetyltransferase